MSMIFRPARTNKAPVPPTTTIGTASATADVTTVMAAPAAAVLLAHSLVDRQLYRSSLRELKTSYVCPRCPSGCLDVSNQSMKNHETNPDPVAAALPADLVRAQARHMIASSVLLNEPMALWTLAGVAHAPDPVFDALPSR
jgi:hypothetical protein